MMTGASRRSSALDRRDASVDSHRPSSTSRYNEMFKRVCFTFYESSITVSCKIIVKVSYTLYSIPMCFVR